MIRLRHRSLSLTSALAALMLAGCDPKKPPTTSDPRVPGGQAKDAESTALATLESKPHLTECRTVLQQLDNFDTAHNRPVLSESERAELTAFFRLTPTESAEISQATFSQTDGAYLEECLLVRAGVRSLKIDSRPPLERARLGFDWACRMLYVDDRVPWTANPWTTLQAGSGIALSRAYVILAVWQQLGLDGCLIGPPALKTTVSFLAEGPGLPIKYAPARACGLKIGADVFLFDHTAGQAVPAADGKGVLTLAQAKAGPDAVKTLAGADEVKSWQPFLAPSLSALSRRMEWLEKLNPGGTGINLFVDVKSLREQFAADLPNQPIDAWNPQGDLHTATRVLGRYLAEERDQRVVRSIREQHRVKMAPLEYLANANLAEETVAHVQMAFVRGFEALRYGLHSPRDSLLRGYFAECISSLEDVKKELDNARTRIDQDKTLQKAFEAWALEFQRLAAQMIRARERDPDSLPAAVAEFDSFRNTPQNRDIERAFVLGQASRPLGAEVAFLMASCVHERAERAQLDDSASAPEKWRNARFWWEQFLDASAQARSPYPARDAHARALLARCQQFISK